MYLLLIQNHPSDHKLQGFKEFSEDGFSKCGNGDIYNWVCLNMLIYLSEEELEIFDESLCIHI